jgi:hypothetical protein
MEKQEHQQWVQHYVPIIQQFIDLYGLDAFQVAVFYGAWEEGIWHYIHPYPELKDTPLFDEIQVAACYLVV